MATNSVDDLSVRLAGFMDEWIYRMECFRPAHVEPRNEEEWTAWEAQLERGRRAYLRSEATRTQAHASNLELGMCA
jgi:ferric-dicitrate binding protein FerR (iron transport regulator)